MAKFSIREGVFETNSSSVHSLSVYKGNPETYRIPEKVELTLYDYRFGWEEKTYCCWDDKLAYLYLIADSMDYDKEPEMRTKLNAMLHSFGVKEIEVSPEQNPDGRYFDYGYIDHTDGAYDFLEKLLNEPELLKDFVFNPASSIETGNDNADYIPEEDSNADYSYIKSN